MALSHRFKCPKCKRKSLARFTPDSLVIQGMSEFYMYNNQHGYKPGPRSVMQFSQRAYGEPTFVPEENDKRYWGCKHQCGFVIPVKSTAELYVWLIDNDMLDDSQLIHEGLTVATFINEMVRRGAISQDFLNNRPKKLVTGPYVPPVMRVANV